MPATPDDIRDAEILRDAARELAKAGERIAELEARVAQLETRYAKLRVAFRVNMIRAFPNVLHADIDEKLAEIETQ